MLAKSTASALPSQLYPSDILLMVCSLSTVRRSYECCRIPRVVLRLAPGPTWKSGRPEEQPGWDAHAEFIDDLIDRGVFIMGGPWTDRLGSMSLWEGMNAEEVGK